MNTCVTRIELSSYKCAGSEGKGLEGAKGLAHEVCTEL